MGRLIIILFMGLIPGAIKAGLFQVGPSRTYVSPGALYQLQLVGDGDTIEIDAAEYKGTAALAVWDKNRLLIRGVGGRPQLRADGQQIWGKGIWVLAGNDIMVENMEFSGAAVPDHNGAGIRLDGVGMTIRHCYFHDNENGILTSNPNEGDIIIEYSEFGDNGYGDGYTHNLYIGHVASLTFRFNYTHHAHIGHTLKSRATNNYILYNRIMDEETGNSSRLIDLPNGGVAFVMGNLLMKGTLAENNNLVGYGLEGLSNPGPHQLYMINNTCVNKRVASGLFVSIQSGADYANVSNNIFAGKGALFSGDPTVVVNNLQAEDIASLKFIDEPQYDYHLDTGSPAIDYGATLDPVNGYSLTPDSAYLHPSGSEGRKTAGAGIDAGAYEYAGLVAVTNPGIRPPFEVFPNPASAFLFIRSADKVAYDGTVCIFDQTGKCVRSYALDINMRIPVYDLPAGPYYYRIITGDSGLNTGRFMVAR